MNLKQLKAKLAKVNKAARAKLAEITDDTSAADASRIEAEHRELTAQIATLEAEVRAAKESEGEDEERAADGDDDDDKNGDDEGDDTTGSRAAGNKSGTVLTRSAIIELGLVFEQCRDQGIDLGISLTDAITGNKTADAIRQIAFKKLATKSKDGGPTSTARGGDVEIIRDEREGVADAMQIALTQRLLNARGRSLAVEYKGGDIREQAWVQKHRKQSEQYLGLGLVEMAAQVIGYRGRNSFLTPGDSVKIFERAFNSTSDFPNIFQNALNKALLARYQLAAPTYREIATERTFNDFRPHPQIRAGDFPQLKPVLETGELAYASTTDNGESISVVPYGIVFSISRQMLVNDDLGAIDQILGSAGDMVLVFENTTFYTMFNSNPTLLQDTTAVFATGHNNLASVGAVITVSSLSDARKAFRQQKSISGNLINVPPSIILTGPVAETAADQIVASISPTLSTSVNPFSGRLRSVSDANITDNSWYIAADPAKVPNFVYGFLAGSGGPRTRTYEPFGAQGVKVSLEHDFGVGAIDFRGMYKNPGA